MKPLRVLTSLALLALTTSLTLALNHAEVSNSAPALASAPPPSGYSSNPYLNPNIPTPSLPTCEDLNVSCWSTAVLNYQNKVADVWGKAAFEWDVAEDAVQAAYAAAQAAFEQCESAALQNGTSTEPCYTALAAATASAAATHQQKIGEILADFNAGLARQQGAYQTAAQACCP